VRFSYRGKFNIEDSFLTGDGGKEIWEAHIPRWWRLPLWWRWFNTNPWNRRKDTMTVRGKYLDTSSCWRVDIPLLCFRHEDVFLRSVF
jgi:hypothetical protein